MVLVTESWRRRGHRNPAGGCLSGCRGKAEAHALARCDPGWRARSMGRWDLRRRCSCGGCGWSSRRPATPRPSAIRCAGLRDFCGAGSAQPWVSIARPARANSADGRTRAADRAPRRSALVRGGRKARHIGPLFADSADQALALVDAHRPLRNRAVADRRHPTSRTSILRRPDATRLDRRAAVSAHAFW